LSSVLSLSVNILEFELGAIERSDLRGCNLLRFEGVNARDRRFTHSPTVTDMEVSATLSPILQSH